MAARGPLSYAQRHEDTLLLRCFGEQTDGFYIDIGNGHPIFDNASYAFYLKGWRGITVEPNPALARLNEVLRPRDRTVNALVGAKSGQATFHLVHDFHGLSTTIESHAKAAQTEFGKSSQTMTMPVTTLAALCADAPATIDFLKIDVEGVEKDVIAGGDWTRFRPKVVLAEALAPYSLAPAWDEWEPILTGHGYRYAHFDSLNRYYVRDDEKEIARALESAPETFDDVVQFRDFKPSLYDQSHPDHRLAAILGKAAMARLPLLDPALVGELLTFGLSPGDLDRPATGADLIAAFERLFGAPPPQGFADTLKLSRGATVRALYQRLADTDLFRAAAGRISASDAW